MHKQTIRVLYPTGNAKMVLRTEQNWDANIEPVGQNDCVSKFAIETERPYLYFKPVRPKCYELTETNLSRSNENQPRPTSKR